MYNVKRLIALILVVVMVILVFPVSSVFAAIPLTDDQILDLESKACFDFF